MGKNIAKCFRFRVRRGLTRNPATKRNTMTMSSGRERHPLASLLSTRKRRAFASQLPHATTRSTRQARRVEIPRSKSRHHHWQWRRVCLSNPLLHVPLAIHKTKTRSHHHRHGTRKRANRADRHPKPPPWHPCPRHHQLSASRCTNLGRKNKRHLLLLLAQHQSHRIWVDVSMVRGIHTHAPITSQ